MSIYRFPPLAKHKDVTIREQLNHVCEEAEEARCAYNDWLGTGDACDSRHLMEELLDTIHAAETALRRNFREDEVERMRAHVIRKNAQRGYYTGGK